MKHIKGSLQRDQREQGAPFYSFTPDGHTAVPSVRVMPSRFAFPVLPAACTFIRDLGIDRDSGSV